MLKYLKNLLEKRKAKLVNLQKRNNESEDLNEVRSLGVEIQEITEEIRGLEMQISELENAAKDENRSGFDPAAATTIATAQMGQARNEEVDPYSTIEYRTAFKNYVQKGIDNFPKVEARANEFTISTEVGKIIPNTILNEFIKKVSEKHGQIYAKVRKLSIQGGVEIPISDLAATAVWISEEAVSETKKAGTINTSITFKYHTLELRISETLLASIVTLDVFENEIVRIMVEAFAKEMDLMILTGTGTGQPLGILKDPRVTQVVEMTEADFADWTKWRSNLFAKVPLAKRGGGEFLFTPSTWETYLMSMKDNNNRPLGREAAGVVDGAYAGTFFGREATLVEPIAIKDFATAVAGDVVGVFWIPSDYIVNTNLQLAYKRYFNDDTNKWVNKGLVITDGKIADTTGCYIIKKKVAV